MFVVLFSLFASFGLVLALLSARVVSAVVWVAVWLQQQPDWTDLNSVLVWLSTVGGPYFVIWVLSLVAENWPKWHELPGNVKFLIPLVASPVVAILATLLLQQTQAISVVAPWYTIIAGSVLAYLGSQQGYMSAKRSGYGEKAKLASDTKGRF
jgi:hypothetical protein